MANWYVDASAPAGGDGTLATPYNALSAINWAVIAAGDTINLARGSVFREVFSPAISNVTITAYGAGAIPVISGSDLIAGWTPTIGEDGVYEATCALSPMYVFFGKQRRMTGSAATSAGLPNNKNWYWAGGKLYIKSSDGHPDTLGWLVEAAVRANGVLITGTKGGLTFKYLHITHCTTYAMYQSLGSSGNVIHACEVSHSTTAIYLDSYTITGDANAATKVHHIYGTAIAAITAKGTCLLERLTAYYLYAAGIAIGNYGIITINKATISGSHLAAVETRYATSTVVLKNSIISGCNKTTYALNVYATLTSGSFTVSNTLLTGIGAPSAASNYTYMTILHPSVVDGGGNTYHAYSGFRQMPPVYLMPTFDDFDLVYDTQVQNAARATGRATFTGVTHFRNTEGDATLNTLAQQFVANGGEIGIHGRDHVDLTVVHPLTVQYVGAGTTSTISIANNVLVLKIDGVVDKTLDLTAAAYDTIGELKTYLDGLAAYTCTSNANSSVSKCINLADLADVDIKTAPYPVAYNLDKFYDYELQGNINDIYGQTGGQLATTGAYPGGQMGTEEYITATLQRYGIMAMRTVTQLGASHWPYSLSSVVENMPLLLLYCLADQLKGTNTSGLVIQLTNGADVVTDESVNANTMTLVGSVTRTNAVPAAVLQGYYSSQFAGGYLYRASLTGMRHRDLAGKGDWQWGTYLYPTAAPTAPAVATLFWHQIGTGSPTDYHWLYMDSDRLLHYEIVKSGSSTLHLTANAALPLNTATNIVVRQVNGKTEIIHYDASYVATVVASSTSTESIEATGRFQIGASYLSGAAGNYYTGHMDNAYVGRWAWQLGIAQVEMGASNNMPLVWYGHTLPHPTLLRTMFEAWANYSSSPIYLKPLGQALTDWLADGELDADGLYLHRPAYTPDFHLQIASPANRAGDGVTYLGALPPVSGRKIRSYRRP